MKFTRTRLLVVGLLILVLGLVASFPARVAYRWFAPPAFAMAGIDGTIWRGRAAEAQAGGVYLRDLEWRLQPAALFTGRLAYQLAAATGDGFVDTRAAIGFGGAVELEALQASLPLRSLETPLNMPGLRGMANARFERIRIEGGLPVAMDGALNVAGLLAPKIDRNTVIGGYRIEFLSRDNGILASVEDTDGIVDLAGTFELDRDRSYRFQGLVAAKPTTPDKLTQQMRFLGTPNDRGQYPLRLEGSL